MTREELLADVAYARTLAEEGRQAPLLGGAHLIFWGVLNAAAFAAHWAQVQGVLPFGEAGFAVIWMSYGVVAAIGMTLLRQRVRGKPGITTLGARAERAVWTGVAAAILAVVAGSIGRMIISGDVTAPNAILGAGFALYGAALFAVSTLTHERWLGAFGWLAVLTAGAVCLFANAAWAYLIAAGASLLVLAWPGILLVRREPAAIV